VHFFSFAHCVGYVAFVLGVSAFLQKSDRKLKALNASESMVYAVHFTLLGNPSAAACALLSGIRSFLSLKVRSTFLAVLFIVINVGLGFVFAKGYAGWFPVIGSCLATLAIFLMRGVRMRMVLLMSTLLWLTNNILSGSIGGTLLEATIATVNSMTIIQILRERTEILEAK
jgi:hypothetical protein